MKRSLSFIPATVLAISLITPSFALAAETAKETPAPSSAPIKLSCHDQHDPILKQAIREETAAYVSTLTQEWRRQTDFRIRAATTSVGKKLRQQNLRRSEQKLNAAFAKFNSELETLTADDIIALDDLLGADLTSDADIQKWSGRTPSFVALDKALSQLRLDLLRYANATDRKIITRVWAEKLNAFRTDLKQKMAEDRQRFVQDLQDCYAGAPADEVLTEKDAPDDTSSPKDDKILPDTIEKPIAETSKTTPKDEVKPTFSSSTYDLVVTSVYIKVLPEASDDASCSQRTVANAYIYANGRAQITGFFALEDGSRYPNVSFPTDESGFVHARQILDYGTGAIAPMSGAVKFVVLSPTSISSVFAPFKRSCASVPTSSSWILEKPVETTSVSGTKPTTESTKTAPKEEEKPATSTKETVLEKEKPVSPTTETPDSKPTTESPKKEAPLETPSSVPEKK